MKKKSRYFNELTYIYGIGFYFLGVSIVFFLNLLVTIPWHTNLFFSIIFFSTSMLLISKSKRMSKELIKKKKKVRGKNKNDKKREGK